MLERNEFSTFEVMKILGISCARIREWIDGEFICPSIQLSPKQGVKSIFSRWDLYGIELFKRYVNSGISRSQSSDIFTQWIL